MAAGVRVVGPLAAPAIQGVESRNRARRADRGRSPRQPLRVVDRGGEALLDRRDRTDRTWNQTAPGEGGGSDPAEIASRHCLEPRDALVESLRRAKQLRASE